MAARWMLVVLALVAATGGAEEMSSHYDCIVVGMGAAGTVAAATLARGGKRVLALEATERVGGRVRTVPFAGGVVELGAEWIQGQFPSRTYKTAVEHNVTVLSQALEFDILRSDGSQASPALLDIINKGVEIAEGEHNVKPQPLGEYVTNKLMDYIKDKHPEIAEDKETIARVLEYLDQYVDSTDATDSWMDLNAGAPYETLGGDQHLSWHRRGYKTFFELMLNTYKGGPGLPSLEIKLNSPVTRVQWPQQAGQPVQVTCSDGRQYSADTAIVTLSLGVLKEKHATLFSPPLSENKVTAIDKLGMGVIGKIIFSFDKTWWGKNFYGFLWKPEDIKKVPAEEQWTTKLTGMSSPMGCDNALTMWTSGATARLVETLPEEEVKTKALALLRRFFGPNVTIPEPTGMLRSKWFANEWTRGTYSYTGMSAAGVPDARRWLAAPLTDDAGRARLLLAGEAAHDTRFATVHGAADSGYDAAMMLLGSQKSA